MPELDVGQVSGLIATGVFIVQLLLALALPLILIAFLKEESTVVTWSVLGRVLHSSHWPTILQSDTAATTSVRRSVVVSGRLQTAILALVSIASIITPFGLYDTIAPAKSQTEKFFSYLQDDSAFGYGTPPRSDAPFTRVCGSDFGCPGQTFNQTCNEGGNNCSVVYDPRIPTSIRDLFSNGATKIGSSVSSLFDIQWRTYNNGSDDFSILGWYLQYSYRQLSELILDGKVEAIEGLIVDMVAGGVGFRNHTAPLPPPLQYGSMWTEDILFIEPETQCVDLNITLDFNLPADVTAISGYENLTLTDRGGLSGLSRINPGFDTSPNGQTDLNLKQRAYNAAWLNNFMTLVFYNATDPDSTNITRLDLAEGASFSILTNSTGECSPGVFTVAYDAILSSIDFGGYLPMFNKSDNESMVVNGISQDNFTTITELCAGTTAYSDININGSVVGCSLLYGAANRTDGGSALIGDPGSPWSIPIYSCATAIKATIRTVTFQYNGTGIEALNITGTAPKHYQDNSSLPLWGVETLPEEIDFSTAQPLWGIIGSANSTPAGYMSIDNISTILQESLYLPGYMDEYYFDYGFSQSQVTFLGQNLPGVDFYSQALATALSISSPCVVTYQGYADYSGMTSLALFAKWQNLSRNADTASTILNLVWTDAAANSVVGTKGWGLTSGSNQQVLVPVTVYRKVILYRLPFAIPAFIVLAAAIAVLFTLILLTLTRKTGLGRMRALLEATSAGRIIGMSLWPEKRTERGTKEWIAAVGIRSVSITSEGIVAGGESVVEEAEDEAGIEHGDGATDRVSETKATGTPISETQLPRTRTMDTNLYLEVPLKDEPVVKLSPSATVRRKALPEPSEH